MKETYYCSNCGTEVPHNELYICYHCGHQSLLTNFFGPSNPKKFAIRITVMGLNLDSQVLFDTPQDAEIVAKMLGSDNDFNFKVVGK